MTNEEKRRLKHPETSYYQYKNVNPKNKITSDCVFRAISNATGIDYGEVVVDMAYLQAETGYDSGENRLIDMYLSKRGWVKMKQPRKFDNTKFTGKEFIDNFCHNERHKRVIISIGSGHLSSIVNGKFEDIWNCSSGKVGVYWIRSCV